MVASASATSAGAITWKVQVRGFRFWDSGFRIQVSGFRFLGFRLKVQGVVVCSNFSSLGFWAQGVGYSVL
jgi:hypothetical protein